MTRALFSLALAAAVYLLGNALADHAWLAAAPLAALVIAGIFLLAPRASASPAPASATEVNALATGEGL